MKKILSQIACLALSLSFVAALSFAYTNPTASSSANDTAAPINVSSTAQIKNGNLSVNTFQVQADAYFAQDLYLNGIVHGEYGSSTVSVGGISAIVGADINGKLENSERLISPSLAHSGDNGNYAPICADDNGILYLCGGELPPVAQCGDGSDNDSDGLTDYPADPGCEDADDNDEENYDEYSLSIGCGGFANGGCYGDFISITTGQTYHLSSSDTGTSISVPAGVYEWQGGDLNSHAGCPFPSAPADISPSVGTQEQIGNPPYSGSFGGSISCN